VLSSDMGTPQQWHAAHKYSLRVERNAVGMPDCRKRKRAQSSQYEHAISPFGAKGKALSARSN
jgi:hypothetical protein